MLLVMPVCAVDLDMARNVSTWIRMLGPEPRHRALLVWSAEVAQYDRDFILDNFNNTFPRVNQMQPQFPPDVQGWPDAPNLTFEYVVHYCCCDAPFFAEGQPWYFFEADNTPMRKGWLNELEAEYSKCGKPCMGVLEQSWMVDRDTNQKIPAGKHLVGTSIYPGNLHTLTDAFRGARKVAFDVLMQGHLVDGGHCAHTNLIQHCWLTRGYKREKNGDIVCQAREGRLPGQIGFSLPRTISKDAVPAVVHGCKDGSLLQLLMDEHEAAQKRAARIAKKQQKTEQEQKEAAALASLPLFDKYPKNERPPHGSRIHHNAKPNDPDEVKIAVAESVQTATLDDLAGLLARGGR